MSESKKYDWSKHDWSKGPVLRAEWNKFKLLQDSPTNLYVIDKNDKAYSELMDVDGIEGEEIPNFSPPRWISAMDAPVDLDQLALRYYIKFGGKFCIFIFCFEDEEMMWLTKSAFITAVNKDAADKFIAAADVAIAEANVMEKSTPKANGVGKQDGRIQDANRETDYNVVDLRTPSPPLRRELPAKTIEINPQPATRQRRGSSENSRGTQIPPGRIVYESIEERSGPAAGKASRRTQSIKESDDDTSSPTPSQQIKRRTRPDNIEIKKVIYNRLRNRVIHAVVERENGTYDIIQSNEFDTNITSGDRSRSLALAADTEFVHALTRKGKLNPEKFKMLGCAGQYNGKVKIWRLVIVEVKDEKLKTTLRELREDEEEDGDCTYDGPLLISLSTYLKAVPQSGKARDEVDKIYMKTEFAKSVSANGEDPLRHTTVTPNEDEKRGREDARRRMEEMEKRVEEKEKRVEEKEKRMEEKEKRMEKKMDDMIEQMKEMMQYKPNGR
jgi:hypothetical protein